MVFREKNITICLLILLVCLASTGVGATHISKPIVVNAATQYKVGQKIVINGWVDYNAQPTADVLLNFQVTTENEVVIAETSYPSDKQGHFQFEFDTRNLLPGIYLIVITSHCLEIHRNICSYNSETLTVELNYP